MAGGGIDPWSEPTTSGQAVESTPREDAPDSATAILEVRRLSGLTWDQLARLFHVGRRSLHFWASGKSPNAGNQEQLRRTLNTIRAIDRGSASENRVIVFEGRGGRVPFDLLAAGAYDEVVELLGRGPGRRRLDLPSLSEDAQEARRPVPPTTLTDARQETVHREVGRGRSARTRKARRRGRK